MVRDNSNNPSDNTADFSSQVLLWSSMIKHIDLDELTAKFTKKLSIILQKINSGYDEFGTNPEFIETLRPFFEFMYEDYFRVETVGLENIPSKGRAILVANHSGTIPFDGTMVHLAAYNKLKAKRSVRFLVDDFIFKIPFLGTIIERIGGIKASMNNAIALLKKNHIVCIFPEGIRGIGKTYDQRYKLEKFGRGGFIKLAMRTNTPIIPVSIIGAEEIYPLIWKSEELGAKLGVPYVPFTPTFPWLGPLGLLPLPSKWKIIFGKPIKLSKYTTDDAENQKIVDKEAEKIQSKIQKTLDSEIKKRKSIWI